MWWERDGLRVSDGRLEIAGRDAESLAREHGTPLYAFDLTRVEEQVRALQGVLAGTGMPSRVRFALKSQREPEVLARVRGLGAPGMPGSVGMDVCSPGEVLHALENGWEPSEISYTATNVSERDLDGLLARGIHVNLDLLTQLRRYGRRASPGTRAGIRVNPRAGAGYGSAGESHYSRADKPGKFGIYAEQLPETAAIAREHELVLDTVHFHVGDGYLTDGLPDFERAVERVADMVRVLAGEGCPIAEVNAGGGLGVPQGPADEPLDLDAWAAILARHFGAVEGLTLSCEPGDFISKQAGVLLAEVVTVEDRLGVPFAGVDAGFNVGPEHFIYGEPLPLVLARDAAGEPAARFTVSGNINEGPDLWGEDVPLPGIREGDIVAMLQMGTYGQSMAMSHCLRPPAGAVYFDDRLPRE